MKKLLIVAGVLVALLGVTYFVVTSSGFLKSMVLPRVAAALNADVDAESIALSPFSSVEIRNLTVTPRGAERLATVELARVRYSLFSILGGNMAVDEILVRQPVVTVVQKADGTSNLDPILKHLASQPAAPAQPASGSSKPAQVDLKSLRVENGSLAYKASAANGAQTAASVTGLSVDLQNVKNGGAAKLNLGANLKVDQTSGAAGAVADALQGTLSGAFDMAFSPELVPTSVSGKANLAVPTAAGAYKEFQGFATVLTADLTPTELKRLAVDFQRQNVALGSISARGPLDMAKKEGRLQVDIAALDRNVLNLAGAAAGLDFTTTRFDSTNTIELAAGGNKVTVVGAVKGTKVSVKKGDLTMPPVDLDDRYDMTVDLSGQSALVRAFSLTGVQAGREVLRGSLSKPLQISWAPNAGAVPDASVLIELAELRLADWSALAGVPVKGTLSARADLGVQNSGKDLAFQVKSGLTGFSGTFGSNEVRNLGLNAEMAGKVAAFADVANRRLTAAMKVSELNGEAAVVNFKQYEVEAKADIGLPQDAVVMNDVQAQMRAAGKPGGTVSVRGRWDLKRGAGDLSVAARDLNEVGLAPFLQAALGDKQLRSIKVSSEATLKMDPAAESTIKMNAELKDLVVRDPSGAVPESPLAAGLTVDMGGTSSKLVIRQGELRLTPTARAKNQMNLAGDLDFSKTNALKGAFKLTAESVDVTPYYDLFAGTPKPAAAGTPAPAPAPTPSTGPQKEPDAIHLPVDVLSFEARIGKFFLREVAAENWVAAMRLTATTFELQPLELALNGAPIKAGMKVGFGVPGYEYDLKLSADHVPVRPFANSFAPSLKNRIEGAMNVSADVKGAGVTGTSLQKSLAGALSFNVTNANLKLLDDSQQKGVLSVLARLLATSLNIHELQDQPIMDIIATAKMGGGKIELTDASARSSSLLAGTSGTIPIATDLMQSPLKFPVNVSLRRDLAIKAGLARNDTPTNMVYVALPEIASMKGTLGTPQPEVDKVRVGLLLAKGVSGILGGSAGSAVGGVADLVGGLSKGGTNAAGNLIQGLGNLLGGGAKTAAPTNNAPAGKAGAAPATNAPAAQKNPLGGLLKSVLEPPPKKAD